MTERPHGYARYKLDNCRCYTCAYAVSQYNERRNAALNAGEWQPFTPAAAARDHIRSLMAAGMGYKLVARLAGVNDSTVGRLIYGEPRRETIRTGTARAILAVRPTFRGVADRVRVPNAGTTRRIQALAVFGYGLLSQADHVGWTIANFSGLASGRRPLVSAATARAVADMYDLWSMSPPADSFETRRVQRFAAKRLWLPPLVWDDDEIDDPAAVPCVLPPVDGSDPGTDEYALTVAYFHLDVPISRQLRDEFIRRMTIGGYTMAEIAPYARTSRAHVSNLRSHLELTFAGRAEAAA